MERGAFGAGGLKNRMRKNILWAVITIVAALLENTWLKAISIQEVLPNLVLLLVVYFALQGGEERAMFTGFLGGVIQDVAGNARLGHHVLAHVLVGYIAGRLSKRLIAEHPAIKAGLAFFASLLDGVFYIAILKVQRPSDIETAYMIGTNAIPTAFYTALVTPVIFFLLDRAFRREWRLEGTPA